MKILGVLNLKVSHKTQGLATSHTWILAEIQSPVFPYVLRHHTFSWALTTYQKPTIHKHAVAHTGFYETQSNRTASVFSIHWQLIWLSPKPHQQACSSESLFNRYLKCPVLQPHTIKFPKYWFLGHAKLSRVCL